MIEYKRIYHSHIRKCAGTSFNKLIIGSYSTQEDSVRDEYYSLICKNQFQNINGKIFAGFSSPQVISSGNYFYCWSHTPFWSFKLQPDTFCITNFRDPLERLLSHYSMIKQYYDEKVNHPGMRIDGKWLGESKTFMEFIGNMPKSEKLAQLYHYSKNYSIDEAIENISKVDFIGRVETLTERGYDALKKIIPQLNFPNEHLRKSKKQNISQVEIDYAKELLEEEYKLIKRVEFSY